MGRSTHHLRAAAMIVAASLLASCSEPSGPRGGRSIAIEGDFPRFGLVGAPLQAPFRARVTGGRSASPVPNTSVSWRVVRGTGATVTPSTSLTDSAGVATAQLTLGPDTGVYRVEASLPGLRGAPAVFEARAVRQPEILAITPDPAPAGATVRITGQNFSPVPADHAVLFGGFRGAVLGGTATQLDVVVPGCVPNRAVGVTVELGPVRSVPAPLEVLTDDGDPLALAVGEGTTLADAAGFACVRLPAGPTSAAYLVVAQNAHDLPGEDLPFQLAALTGPATEPPPLDPTPVHGIAAPAAGELAARWEARLRARERALRPETALPSTTELRPLARTAPPEIGDQREFQVIDMDNDFTRVTAEVKYVSSRAVLYQDIDAPTGGFTAADFEAFGRLFDDPIHDTVIAAFGSASDVDADGRIIILFTPVVNEMTPPGSNGFIAGFFYGLDLTTEPNSNHAEIFYSLVPDPTGEFSDARATSDVLRVVPPVLAHEFQHMIHFNQRFLIRQVNTEVLWLSEALAHTAEDLVGAALRARGDDVLADNFVAANLSRAQRYLVDPGAASLISDESPGSLEERGAQWLFVKYIAGHYGGADLLRSLTQTTASGVVNVTAATGRNWPELLTAWSVALWADDAPELQGLALDPGFTFPNLDLREEFARFDVAFPLQPVPVPMQDFVARDTLPAASMDYLLLLAPAASPPPLNLNFAGPQGAAFAGTDPRLMILRVR